MKGPVPGYVFTPHPERITTGGVYLLTLHLPAPTRVSVGALGELDLDRGTYIYTGSAKRGLHIRVGRHLKREKSTRWHIDHLTNIADELGVWWREYTATRECDAADLLARKFSSVEGFGSSDCRCGSHLFFTGPDRRWLR